MKLRNTVRALGAPPVPAPVAAVHLEIPKPAGHPGSMGRKRVAFIAMGEFAEFTDASQRSS